MHEKFLLSIREAAQYFNIGENKLRKIASEYYDSEYKIVIQNGNRVLFNRKNFENFLNNLTSIKKKQ